MASEQDGSEVQSPQSSADFACGEPDPQQTEPVGGQPHWCTECGLGFNGPAPLASHLAGKKHQKRLRQLAPTPRCNVCEKDFASPSQLAEHKNGRKHQKRLQEAVASGRSTEDSEAVVSGSEPRELPAVVGRDGTAGP